jgi:A/G-specific adenine glycosylase
MSVEPHSLFLEGLSSWFAKSHRPLPWKGVRDPYIIWLSEIILQQTRVEQGLPYFERFRDQYPAVKDLADASEDEVMKRWEGLGYYSRARNLHAAAKYVAYELNGHFPDTYEGIRKLKGVGPYTAAAIASFAYGLPTAVVDGNVYRVLSRFWGMEQPIDSTAGKKAFAKLAQELIERSPMSPAQHNQAMMDFGATHCKPKAPLCKHCPLQPHCVAYQSKRVDQLPIKQKKLVKKHRYFHYLLLNHGNQVYIRKRSGKDIWRNLYEFPLLEADQVDLQPEAMKASGLWQSLIGQQPAQIQRRSQPRKQTLTHQYIHAVFWEILLPEHEPLQNSEGLQQVDRENLSKFAFPKIIDWYLKDNSLYLNLL